MFTKPCLLDEVVEPYFYTAWIAVDIIDEVLAILCCEIWRFTIKRPEEALIHTDRPRLEFLHSNIASGTVEVMRKHPHNILIKAFSALAFHGVPQKTMTRLEAHTNILL